MKKDWKIRRRIVIITLVFCASIITYITIYGNHNSRLHETIVLGIIGLGCSTIGSYVFGVVWDDKNSNNT